MFDNILILYLITRLDEVRWIAGFFSVIGVVVLIASTIGYFACTPNLNYNKQSQEHDKSYQDNWVILLKYCRWLVVSFTLLVLIPSKEDVKFIIAGTGLIEIAKSDTAKEIATKSVSIVEKYLDRIDENVTKKEQTK